MNHNDIKTAIKTSKSILDTCLGNYELTGIEAYSNQAKTEQNNLKILKEMYCASFSNQWKNHIVELRSLCWNLDNKEDTDKLDNAIEVLKTLADKAGRIASEREGK